MLRRASIDPELFWSIIDQSRAQAEADNPTGDLAELAEAQAEYATELLLRCKPTEIVGFQQYFNDRMAESYRRDVWAVAYIVNGGCSDDGFEYFRAWMIGQGREYYEAALRNPERAADRISPDDEAENEDLWGSAVEAYEKTDRDMPEVKYGPLELVGREWTEDDLPRLYP